jgi:hypothetical protein
VVAVRQTLQDLSYRRVDWKTGGSFALLYKQSTCTPTLIHRVSDDVRYVPVLTEG